MKMVRLNFTNSAILQFKIFKPFIHNRRGKRRKFISGANVPNNQR
jgi:hypothetical protein